MTFPSETNVSKPSLWLSVDSCHFLSEPNEDNWTEVKLTLFKTVEYIDRCQCCFLILKLDQGEYMCAASGFPGCKNSAEYFRSKSETGASIYNSAGK